MFWSCSCQQILSHLDESGSYTADFLQGFQERLNQLRSIIKHDAEEGRHPEPVLKYMSKKLDGNGEAQAMTHADAPEAMLKELSDSLKVLSIELVPIHNRLVPLRKELMALASQPKVNKTEFKKIVEELRKIDS